MYVDLEPGDMAIFTYFLPHATANILTDTHNKRDIMCVEELDGILCTFENL